MSFKDFALNLGGNRRLIFAGIRHGWFWLAAGAVALVLVVIVYGYERKFVSRRTGGALLALRLMAALALVAALFEPIAERTYRESVRGRLIVGVDLSESMTTIDPERSADAADRLGKMLDLKESESTSRLSRREVARRLIAGPWLRRLAAEHDLEAVGFAREAIGDGTPKALADLLKQPVKGDDPSTRWTDWRPVLERALEDKSGAPVLGVVLLTDGRQNAPGDSGAVTDRLAARGIPIDPILIGTTRPPRDAAIAALKAPERVSKGDVADVEVTLKIDGPGSGIEVPVTLERPDASPIKKLARVPDDGTRPTLAFRVPMDQVGPQTLTVSVGPISGDVRPDNDRRTVAVEVTDDKVEVLLIDGDARWEFRYLRNALVRDPHAHVEAVVFHQTPVLGSTESTYPTTLPARPPEGDAAPDPLGAFDAIILGDLDPGDLTAGDWARLESYVEQRGGTLILAAGPRSWPGILGNESVRRLAPIVEARVASVDPTAIDPKHPTLPPGLALTLTPAAESGSWPMFRFAAGTADNRAIWAGLPQLPWVLSGRPKPTATILATIAGAGPEAAIAAQAYGLGKVLWIGTDGTWRWRYRVGDRYHHRFWGQALRWADASKLTVGNRLVQYGPLRPRTPEGQRVAIRARFADDAPGIVPDLLIAARIVRAGRDSSVVAIVPLRPRTDQPRTFEGTAPTLPEGSYRVLLDAPQLSGLPDATAPFDVVAPETTERIELAAARDPLDRLASATGGRVLSDSDAGELPGLLKARIAPRIRVEPTSLWDRPGALIAFFAILTVEWVLRKRSGLP